MKKSEKVYFQRWVNLGWDEKKFLNHFWGHPQFAKMAKKEKTKAIKAKLEADKAAAKVAGIEVKTAQTHGKNADKQKAARKSQ